MLQGEWHNLQLAVNRHRVFPGWMMGRKDFVTVFEGDDAKVG